MSSSEEDGKPLDQVYDVLNVKCNKHTKNILLLGNTLKKKSTRTQAERKVSN